MTNNKDNCIKYSEFLNLILNLNFNAIQNKTMKCFVDYCDTHVFKNDLNKEIAKYNALLGA